jgi:hypothetical protein
MEKDDLERILHGDIDHIYEVNERDPAELHILVPIFPKDVRSMLLAYLSNKITADELTYWAGFICIRAEYCIPNYIDDDMVKYYEDMYYVIQRLSTPQIDGEVNETSVKQYLYELDKYGDE